MKAIGDWLSVLQASGQVVLLEPWFTNISKRVVKTPEVYLADSGLLCYLLNLTAGTLVSSPLLGAVWETFVYSELRKRVAFQETPADIWFYRDQRSREVDFLIDQGGTLNFLEVKWRERLVAGDAKAIATLSHELEESSSPWRAGHHYVLGTPRSAYDLMPGVTAIGLDHLDRVLMQAAGEAG